MFKLYYENSLWHSKTKQNKKPKKQKTKNKKIIIIIIIMKETGQQYIIAK